MHKELYNISMGQLLPPPLPMLAGVHDFKAVDCTVTTDKPTHNNEEKLHKNATQRRTGCSWEEQAKTHKKSLAYLQYTNGHQSLLRTARMNELISSLCQAASQGLLVVLRHRLSSYGRRAFIWNWSSDSLRDPAISRDSFKRSLKTLLFSAYWYT